MARRIGLLVVALAVALFGTGAVLTYASRANARAMADQAPVEVLIAKEVIPAGMTAEQVQQKKLVETSSVPKRVVPKGALTDLAAEAGQVLGQDVQPGEMVLQARFVPQQVAGSIQIPGNSMAMSVQVQDPQRVGGYVLPGSEVAIFDTYAVEKQQPAPAGEPVVDAATRLLLPRVKVIAVGPTALSTVGGEPAAAEGDDAAAAAPSQDPAAVLTVAVDSAQAVKLAHAAQTGRLYFALLSSASRTGDAPAVDNRTLFN